MDDVNRSPLYQLLQFIRLGREPIAIPLKDVDVVGPLRRHHGRPDGRRSRR